MTVEIPTGRSVPGLTDGLTLNATEIDPSGNQAVAIAVPALGANETLEIPLLVRPGPGTQPLAIQAYSGEPLIEDPFFDPQGHLTPKVKECRDELVGAVINAIGVFVPAVDCGKAIYDEYQVFAGQANLKDLIGITAQGLVGCSETFLTKKVQTLAAVGKGLFKAAKLLADGVSIGQTAANVLEIPTDCFTPNFRQAIGALIQVVASQDPNDKLGPVGSGKLRQVSGANPFGYLIRFENYASATADAQYIKILDTLNHDKFDFSTFQFGFFNVADTTFLASPGRKHYLCDWDQRPAKNLILRMEADFIDSTGVLQATYTTLDPQTMKRTEDPILGFLPPNTTAPKGEGSIFFTILPKPELPHSTTVSNKASIYFDYNAPIPTPAWSNVLDKIIPNSQVLPLPQTIADTSFVVRWSGGDTGSGLRLYSLYVATNSGPYKLLVRNTSLSSFTITGGKPDSTYRFYTVAVDSVGNEEAAPITFDTQTRIKLPLTIESVFDGRWDSPTTWTCGCIPEDTSTVVIGHLVTLPPNQNTRSRKVKYKPNGRLKFSTGSGLHIGY